jgi:hypothetical protein
LFIGTPAYNGVSASHERMIAKLRKKLGVRGTKWAHLVVPGCSFLPHARNVIAAGFLKSGCDAAFLVDSDISVDPDVVFRMLESGHDYVSAAWTVRNSARPTRCALELDPRVAVGSTGCIEVRRAGVACTLIRRTVVEKIIEAEPALVYDDRNGETYWNVFGSFIEGRELLHEDSSFSRRWTMTGGKQYVLIDADVEHNGMVMNAAKVLARYRASAMPSRA